MLNSGRRTCWSTPIKDISTLSNCNVQTSKYPKRQNIYRCTIQGTEEECDGIKLPAAAPTISFTERGNFFGFSTAFTSSPPPPPIVFSLQLIRRDSLSKRRPEEEERAESRSLQYKEKIVRIWDISTWYVTFFSSLFLGTTPYPSMAVWFNEYTLSWNKWKDDGWILPYIRMLPEVKC